jgi:hypothetical protein
MFDAAQPAVRFMSYDATPGYESLDPDWVGEDGEVMVAVESDRLVMVRDRFGIVGWCLENFGERPAGWAEGLRRELIESGAATAREVFQVIRSDVRSRRKAWQARQEPEANGPTTYEVSDARP